jgi:transmembrane sensor
MNGQRQGSTEVRADAAAWVVRLHAPEAGESDWLAFSAWLSAEPGARVAYDAAMDLWLLADQVKAAPEIDTRRRERILSRRSARIWAGAGLGLGGLGVAASVVAAFILTRPVQQVPSPAAPTPIAYTSASGQHRTVMLADGSRLDLGGASRVRVSLDTHSRRVTMTSGEVAFTVVHDPRRPFLVTIGDRQVRDLGTEFDIRRAGPEIKVTVRQGRVEVGAKDGDAATVALGAGRQLVHDEATGVSTVRSVAADEAFAWKQGRLIYRDQPLRVVVDDLNRYFPHAVRLEDERVGALRFTGVLTVDGENETIRRLVELLPISATRVGDATVLKVRDDSR